MDFRQTLATKAQTKSDQNGSPDPPSQAGESPKVEKMMCSLCERELIDPCLTCHIVGERKRGRTECELSKGRCGHLFHAHCVQDWRKMFGICITCKQDWKDKWTMKRRYVSR